MHKLRCLFVLLLLSAFFRAGANERIQDERHPLVSELKQAAAEMESNGSVLSEEDFSLLAIPAFGQKINSSVFAPRFFAVNTNSIDPQLTDFSRGSFIVSSGEESGFVFQRHLFFCVLRC